MNSRLKFPTMIMPGKFRLGLVALVLVLTGCGQPTSDSAAGAPDSANAPSVESADEASTGFVSDAPIKAAQQAVSSLEAQQILQSSQASAATARPELTPAEQEARLKAAAAKTDEILKQSAEQAADPRQSP